MTPRHTLVGMLAAITLAACSGSKPVPAPDLALAATQDTLVLPFVLVSAAAPQSDGRWILLAPEEGAVLIADFASDTFHFHAASPTPPAPGPAVLIGFGDTIAVGNWSTHQFTTWLPGGVALDTSSVPQALAGAFPRGRDAAGQWYFEFGPPPGRDGQGLRDSIAIVRTDVALARFDTVARLAPGDVAEVTTAEGTRLSHRALGGRDRWGVMRDGSIWIARVNQNFIEWFASSDGKREKTVRYPDPVLTVQEMDRQLYVNRFPEEYRESAKQVPFAAIKPPFESVIAVAPQRWLLEKNGMALDSTRAFQFVDPEGVIRRLIVPSRGNALGFDGTHLLMAEQFPGGVRLLRYLVPPAAIAERAVE